MRDFNSDEESGESDTEKKKKTGQVFQPSESEKPKSKELWCSINFTILIKSHRSLFLFIKIFCFFFNAPDGLGHCHEEPFFFYADYPVEFAEGLSYLEIVLWGVYYQGSCGPGIYRNVEMYQWLLFADQVMSFNLFVNYYRAAPGMILTTRKRSATFPGMNYLGCRFNVV